MKKYRAEYTVSNNCFALFLVSGTHTVPQVFEMNKYKTKADLIENVFQYVLEFQEQYECIVSVDEILNILVKVGDENDSRDSKRNN